jgi:hypothetical protein
VAARGVAEVAVMHGAGFAEPGEDFVRVRYHPTTARL